MTWTQDDLNREAEAIRDLACTVLKWTRKDVDTFSLAALRSFVRDTKHHDTARLIAAIDNWQREWGLRP